MGTNISRPFQSMAGYTKKPKTGTNTFSECGAKKTTMLISTSALPLTGADDAMGGEASLLHRLEV